ncbi:MAG TPA: tetratricopeptide repeat protein [Rhizomicrobium sp.]|nr:tetratricopeptide repeat protein [Rhizomicrobium sp.]
MLQQWIQEALALHKAGRLNEAEPLYLKALAQDPNFYPALHLMGLIRLHQGRAGEALPYIERALKLQPATPEMLANYGIALEGVGRHAEALAALDRVVEAVPANSRAWNNHGALLHKLGRHEEALADFDRAVGLDAANADAWNNRGLVLMAMNRPAAAVESADRALMARPDYVEARNNRGLALQAQGMAADALAEFDRILKERPDHPGALVNRANVLRATGDMDQALESYNRALARQPDMPEALSSRANLLWTRKGDVMGATADLARLVAAKPDYPYARGDLLHLKMHAGDWQGFGRERAALDQGVRAGQRVVEPYVYQALSSSPADLLACARIYANDRYPPFALKPRRQRRPGKFRIGYLCGEFRAQATMYLAAGLFEQHDRSRFEVVGFDNSRDDQSPMRRRVNMAFDRFIPIQSLSDQDAAKLIEAQDIDILVNLNGYFGAMRMGVFAHHPAPVQVNYLGFPGTLGADYMDYILADAHVIAEGEEKFFTEKVVKLPHSYQINDSQRPHPVPETRSRHGLKDEDFVFCHFNYAYKILPEMFQAWLRLLKAVPGSVLWLLESNPRFAANLGREAAKANVEPSRLIFAPQIENRPHLARLMLGDLFLDSLPYNAHTTGSDALWAGLPLLTCRGDAFAGRVASSLLHAADLPELVTKNLHEYEALAIKLAKNRKLLAGYRDHLTRNRTKLALFDTARTTRHIEAAYEEMMARWGDGARPEGFMVKPI